MGTFHEVLFPVDVSRGSSGGVKFKTAITDVDNGYENRKITWSQVRAEYNVNYGTKSPEQIAFLRAFFMARQGRAFGFRYKDWADYQIVNQSLGVGTSGQTNFQVYKLYVSTQEEAEESWSCKRPVSKLAWGSVTGVSIGGVEVQQVTSGWSGTANQYQVDHNLGLLLFRYPPNDEVFIGYAEFHVPVRFDMDYLSVVLDDWGNYSVNSIPLIEVRDFLFTIQEVVLDYDYGDFDLGAASTYTLISDFGDFDTGIDYTRDLDLGDFSAR